jgi:hypothetical protein
VNREFDSIRAKLESEEFFLAVAVTSDDAALLRAVAAQPAFRELQVYLSAGARERTQAAAEYLLSQLRREIDHAFLHPNMFGVVSVLLALGSVADASATQALSLWASIGDPSYSIAARIAKSIHERSPQTLRISTGQEGIASEGANFVSSDHSPKSARNRDALAFFRPESGSRIVCQDLTA